MPGNPRTLLLQEPEQALEVAKRIGSAVIMLTG